MRKLLIPCMVLILSASCTTPLEEEINEQTTEQTIQYTNLEQGLKAGQYLIDLSTYCNELVIPEYLWERINTNPNDIEAIIKAMQILETQLVFGDTLGECAEYYDDWVGFCTINHISRYYDEQF